MGSPPTTPPRVMRGADGSVAGASGYAPAPAAADNVKYLKGDGTWSALANASAATTAEAIAGTSTTTFLTPANLQSVAQAQLRGQGALDYLQSDGATTNRRIETQYGTLGAVAGSDLTEVDYVFDVPTSNPSARAYIFEWAPANTGAPGAWALVGFIDTDGSLKILQHGSDSGVMEYRQIAYAGFRATYSGRRVRFSCALTGNSTTLPIVWIDGVDISASFAETTGAGTDPNWLPTSLSTTYHLRGYNWPAGYFRPGRPVNRKFTQADVDFVQATGRLAVSDAMGGSMVSLISGNDTTFSATGNWAPGGTSTIAGGKLNLTSANQASNSAVICRPNRRYRVRGTLDSITGGNLQVLTGTAYTSCASAAGAFSFEWAPNALEIFHIRTLGGDGVVDDVTIYDIGALSDPIIQPCLVLDDATPNNRASILVGFTPITNRKDWRIPALVDMSSTGNKQLLSGAVFESPTKQAIDTIESTCAGSPTFSVGDGTTATKYTASVAHTAVRLRETVSANFPADSAKTSLYANVTALHASSTAELIVVRGHRE